VKRTGPFYMLVSGSDDVIPPFNSTDVNKIAEAIHSALSLGAYPSSNIGVTRNLKSAGPPAPTCPWLPAPG
jgi:hypothetical protein